jgi:hypothetical protein
MLSDTAMEHTKLVRYLTVPTPHFVNKVHLLLVDKVHLLVEDKMHPLVVDEVHILVLDKMHLLEVGEMHRWTRYISFWWKMCVSFCGLCEFPCGRQGASPSC